MIEDESTLIRGMTMTRAQKAFSQQKMLAQKTDFSYEISWEALIKVWCLSLFVKLLVLLRRIRIYGLEHIKNTSSHNRLVVSNHPSLMDPPLIVGTAFVPDIFFKDKRHVVWQTPSEKVYKKFSSWMKEFPMIPIKIDASGFSHDAMATRKILRTLPRATITLFPEGFLSFRAPNAFITITSGIQIGKPQNGVGYIIHKKRPTVIPVLIRGADKVLPSGMPYYGMWRFLFHHVDIIYGKPLDLSRFFEQAGSKELYAEIANEVMKAIAALDVSEPAQV